MRFAPYILASAVFLSQNSGLWEGGPVGPDNKTEVTCDYPVALRMKNTGGRDGAGLCVFTSIQNSARWQNVPLLKDFQAFMKQYPGGGYPSKVDKFIALKAQKEGKQVPQYLQIENGDAAFLDAAIATGRMVCITYDGHDMHYGYGSSIAHMVNLVHIDEKYGVITDNNFVGEKQLVWLPRNELLKRWRGNGGGWALILLEPPALPVPHNK